MSGWYMTLIEKIHVVLTGSLPDKVVFDDGVLFTDVVTLYPDHSVSILVDGRLVSGDTPEAAIHAATDPEESSAAYFFQLWAYDDV